MNQSLSKLTSRKFLTAVGAVLVIVVSAFTGLDEALLTEFWTKLITIVLVYIGAEGAADVAGALRGTSTTTAREGVSADVASPSQTEAPPSPGTSQQTN